MLYGAWKNGDAHIFSVVKTENGVRLVDGQVADADVSSYLDGMHFGPELPATHKSWADVLTDQNEALERGRMQFLEELADASTNRPGLNRIGVGGLMLTEEEQERIAGIVERGPGSGGQ